MTIATISELFEEFERTGGGYDDPIVVVRGDDHFRIVAIDFSPTPDVEPEPELAPDDGHFRDIAGGHLRIVIAPD